MRCSMRESHILQPAMFTSTPISKRRKALGFNFFENSPIPKTHPDYLAIPEQLIKYQNQSKHPISIFKVLGTKKIPLIKEKRETSLKKTALSHPPMVVISDSEEEDKPEISSEVTLPPNLNISSRRKSVKMEMDLQKENPKRVKNRNIAKPLNENLLENEKKKSQKRISRVDAIIDEIMKERKSTVLSPSPVVKLKSEYSVDAIVEEQWVWQEKNDLAIRRVTRSSRSSVLTSRGLNTVKGKEKRNTYIPNIVGGEGVAQTKAAEVTGKLQDIGNIDKISNIRRTRKRATNIIKKENDVQYQKDNELKVTADRTLTPLQIRNSCSDLEKKEIVKKLSNCPEVVFDHPKNESNFIPKVSSRAAPFNENLPVFYNQEEVSDSEWIQVNSQKGVFVKKNFRMPNISNGFVKIEAKCSLLLNSVKSQIFNVAEGRGIFMYDNENMKVKIGPGLTVTVPAGFPCKIINSGIKKDLIFSFVKVYNE